MDEYQVITLVSNWINLILIPFVVWLYRYLANWKKENKEHERRKSEKVKAQELAIMALLRDRILQSGKYFSDLGAVPHDIKHSLVQMGDAYELLGGNGEGHKMIERIKSLPGDDRVMERKDA